MDIALLTLFALNILLLVALWREQKRRRILGVVTSGVISFLLHNTKESERAYPSLISHVKDAFDAAFGAQGFKKLEKSSLLPDDNEAINQIGRKAIQEGVLEIRRTEMEQSLKK